MVGGQSRRHIVGTVLGEAARRYSRLSSTCRCWRGGQVRRRRTASGSAAFPAVSVETLPFRLWTDGVFSSMLEQ